MSPSKLLKVVLIGGWAVGGLLLVASDSFSRPAAADAAEVTRKITQGAADDYVGDDTCKNCHEQSYISYAHTAHAKLADDDRWKDKMRGCESCHGPGRAHVEAGGDKSKIIHFEDWTAKEISDTCLECHSGREEHNMFRRGEHWRNDVGCTDCHSAHPPEPGPTRAESMTFTAATTAHKPDPGTLDLLIKNETELCIGCHTEIRAQFTMPSHHKVLEGAMKCSDCHNPHGGYELKQTRLVAGADGPCIKCHTAYQGPFVYEHAPLRTEGCTVCHSPHGSSNPRLLVRSHVAQLCLECHSNAHDIGAPNTPSFHNLATVRFQNCTTCHVKVHGSHVDATFFR
jgi:predicted CXXCH cytochrome family protein